jgi:hypothetical protein
MEEIVVAQKSSEPRLLGLSPPVLRPAVLAFKCSSFYPVVGAVKDPCDQGGNAYLLLAVLAVLHS